MAVNISIGLDLGSDTLKAAYAFSLNGIKFRGKICAGASSRTAIPAVAFYDAEANKWLYGEEVETVDGNSFSTVVKIKKLLNLLATVSDTNIYEKNKNYYYNDSEFPKFYFPVRKKELEDFSAMCAADMTFSAEGYTPCKVCQNYFYYIALTVRERVKILCTLHKIKDYALQISLAYPSHVGVNYVKELTSLVSNAFGVEPKTVISATKALSVFAINSGKLSKNESSLIFNMGEERINVVKATYQNNGLAIDGVDGHNSPLYLGGNDIDDAVAQYLERGFNARETMGTPSAGSDGHIVESGLSTAQYLFLKDIKIAKLILGMNSGNLFSSGVPVCVSRDLYIQKKLTRREFCGCIGITSDSGVALKIYEYIETELKRALNYDVKKVFLSGGLVETYALTQYLKDKVEKLGVKLYTFEKDGDDSDNDGFNILSHEDAVYAPALGCAIALDENIKVKTVIAMSYGLRLFSRKDGYKPFFAILVEKGTVLKDKNNKFERTNISTGDESAASDDMFMYAAPITEEDIRLKKGSPKVKYFISSDDGKPRLLMPTEKPEEMKVLRQELGVKTVSGGSNGSSNSGVVWNYYNKKRVFLHNRVIVAIGVTIDEEGGAHAYVRNDHEKMSKERVVVQYMQYSPKTKSWSICGSRQSVLAKDVTFDFRIDDFRVQGKD